MRLPSFFARRLAALLASLALVSVMARPVLACDMGHDGHRVTATEQAADPHAGHRMTAVPSEPASPAVPTAPAPACDHVVGCAVMVLSTYQSTTLTPITSMDSAPRTADADVDAPTLAVEPPPPRR